MKINLKKRDIFIFFLTFSILTIYLFIFAPGILTYDSYNQLQQINSFNFNSWHPFFHTFIEMLLLKIWNNPSIIGLFQIIIFSLIWTSICHYNKKEDNRNFILQVILTLFICFNPINFLYAITLWKDILFSYILLVVCFLSQKVMEKDFKCSLRDCIFLSLALVILSKIRYNGMYIALILLIIFVIFLYKKDRKSKMFLKLPFIYIIGIFFISSLNLVYNVVENEKSAVEPKVMQYLSLHLIENNISKNDRKVIQEVANINSLKKTYHPTFSDNTYSKVDHKKYKKYEKKLISYCFKYSIKAPKTFIKFVFDSTSFIWNPTFPKNTIGLILSTDISSVNNKDNLVPYNINKRYYQVINNKINLTLNNNLLKIILYNPAFYMYLSFIIMLILWKKFRYNSFFIMLPNLLNLLIVAISNPIHDVRYIYPNILVFYLLCVILACKEAKCNERKDVKNISK